MAQPRGLEGQVALVAGAGEGPGRAVALALAAHGVRVVVVGPEERALGDVVGEIANGGGRARHLAGDVGDETFVEVAVRKAVDAFGGLDIVVGGALPTTGPTLAPGVEAVVSRDCIVEARLGTTARFFRAALHHMPGVGTLLVTSDPLDLCEEPETVGARAVSLCAGTDDRA